MPTKIRDDVTVETTANGTTITTIHRTRKNFFKKAIKGAAANGKALKKKMRTICKKPLNGIKALLPVADASSTPQKGNTENDDHDGLLYTVKIEGLVDEKAKWYDRIFKVKKVKKTQKKFKDLSEQGEFITGICNPPSATDTPARSASPIKSVTLCMRSSRASDRCLRRVIKNGPDRIHSDPPTVATKVPSSITDHAPSSTGVIPIMPLVSHISRGISSLNTNFVEQHPTPAPPKSSALTAQETHKEIAEDDLHLSMADNDVEMAIRSIESILEKLFPASKMQARTTASSSGDDDNDSKMETNMIKSEVEKAVSAMLKLSSQLFLMAIILLIITQVCIHAWTTTSAYLSHV